jgi:trans-aconitate methyltransferase
MVTNLITSQDNVFATGEGDQWYQRNAEVMCHKGGKFDWSSHLIERIPERKEIRSVVELGCSNGWRLEQIRKLVAPDCEFYGTDASEQAIEAGKKLYPWAHLSVSTIAETNLDRQFDLVVVSFVLHWVARENLFQSLYAIDRHVKLGNMGGGGQTAAFLVIADFLPGFPHKRKYAHRQDVELFTYKQDYAKVFASLNQYKEIARCLFNHDIEQTGEIVCAEFSSQAACVLLKKSIDAYYPTF